MAENNFSYEKDILEFWKKNNIYQKLKEKNEGSELFNSVDGPPYPTGEVHLGHIRNWSIKDAVYRFKRLEGYDVYVRDGYDVHGLPVENKVEKRFNIKTVDELKEFGEERFVEECKNYVDEIIGGMEEARNRLGLWTDRDYYKTSHPDYISMAWKFFKEADKQNLLYKDYKTVAWCPHDQTTLSDYEIKDTYTTLHDPSIYVKFPLKDKDTTTGYEESFLIWTTTPWTLQSNMAIAVNPYHEYSKVLVNNEGSKEVLIIASALVDDVLATLAKSRDISKVEVLETLQGSELEGAEYRHIYLDETPSQKSYAEDKSNHKHLHSIILGDFVTLGEGESVLEKLEKKGYKHSHSQEEQSEDSSSEGEEAKSEGTGLVHIAPGHGFEDFEVGVEYNLPIFCPVGPDGNFTEGKYEGMYFKDVDPVAIDYLKEKGYLLHDEVKTHRYPCCWRCKTPIVYRAADQWWIKRSELTPSIVEQNDNVRWTPSYARESFNNLMKSAGDWPISRQRYWGIPLPIFEDEDGDYVVFESKEELEERIGYKLNDVHRGDLKDLVITNKDTGKEMKPVPFIADVWFDSGCASFASHYGEGLSFEEIMNKYYPIKWITEGEDQMRGWFSSLFTVGEVVAGKPPYNEVLFYRFVMDKHGQKMSKSLGNGIDGMEAIDNWGADGTRYYLLSKSAPEDQVNFDPEDFHIVFSFFNILDNICKFAGGYLEENTLRDEIFDQFSLDVEDMWILYRMNVTLRDFKRYMEEYRIHQALKVLEDFIVKDVSRTYLKQVKDRTEDRDDNLLVVFSKLLRGMLTMVSVAIPFRAESLYQNLQIPNKKESLFLESIPEVDELLIEEAEKRRVAEGFDLAQSIIQSGLNAREKAGIGVRWPLPQLDIVSGREDIQTLLEPFEKMIKESVNVVKLNYDMNDVEISYIVKPNFPKIKESFEDPGSVIKAINQNKYYIAEDLKRGEVGGVFDSIELDYSKHILSEIELKGEMTSSDFDEGSVILHTHQDEILLEEGYLRELVRRVQMLRKEMGLEKKDTIHLSLQGSDSYFMELVDNWGEFIKNKVGASEIRETRYEYVKEDTIKGKNLVVSAIQVDE